MIESKTRPYRLGLDIGANSIGWAALALNANGHPYAILDMGSRVFPDGRTRKSGASLARDRRLARGQRRRRHRYLSRRDELMSALIALRLMPASAKERKALERLDPYELRRRALSETLEPYELGRALFHLNQRRGFKSNRKTGGGEDKKKATQARKDREGLRQAISDSGDPTLGEFLAGLRERRKPVRARPGQELYPERAMYAREFDEIRARQAEDHAITPAQWSELERIIFHQRPLKPVLLRCAAPFPRSGNLRPLSAQQPTPLPRAHSALKSAHSVLTERSFGAHLALMSAHRPPDGAKPSPSPSGAPTQHGVSRSPPALKRTRFRAFPKPLPPL